MGFMDTFSTVYRKVSTAKILKRGPKQPKPSKHKHHKKSPFNRIVDSFNRLIRPFLMITVIVFFAYAFEHPFYFQIVMTALSSTPGFVAQIIMMVITMFGIGKSIKDWRGTDYMDTMENGMMESPMGQVASPFVQAAIQSAPSTKHIDDAVVEVSDNHTNSTIDAWKNKNAV
jgi:hypothetical protein